MSLLPRATENLWDGGSVSRPWYAYFRQRDAAIAALQAAVVQPAPQEGQWLSLSTQVQGVGSIQAAGTLANGMVQIGLVGDAESIGPSWFYGTGPAGERGFQALSDAFDAGAGAAKSVDAGTGVTTFAHADTSSVADLTSTNAGGVVLQSLSVTFDQFGHVLTRTVNTVDLDGRYEALGTAAAFMAAHLADPDPHPQYTTLAEAAAAAPVQSVVGQVGAVTAAQIKAAVIYSAADVGADPAGSASAAQSAAQAYADGKVLDTIADGDTTRAPSRNAVFDALAGKEASFTKGSLIAGTNITLSGTTVGRLVGSGDVTINADAGGSGTVTSVNASGGTTGLSFSGGPITGSGTLTLAGTLAVANGGTGAATASAALSALGGQPLDATLTALAGLSVSANQGVYATGADAFATYTLGAGGRALGGVSGAANTSPYFSALNTITNAPVTTSGVNLWNIGGTANGMPFLSAANTWSLATTTAGGRALLNNAGTANTFPYYSAANTVTLGAITAAGRALLDDADAAAQRATLGAEAALAAGTAGQFYRGDKSWANTLSGPFRASSNEGLSGWQLSAHNPSVSAGASAWSQLSTGSGWAGKVGAVDGKWVAAFAYNSGSVIAGATTTHFESVQDFRCQKNVASYEMLSPSGINGWRFLGNFNDTVNFGFGIDIYSGGSWSGAYVFNSAALFPASDNARACGDPSFRWSVVYAATGTINTSDADEKTPLRQLSEAEARVAMELASLIGIYQWRDALKAKGDSARLHVGPTAQAVCDLFNRYGLDGFRYGVLCFDAWEAHDEIRSDEGVVVQQARAAGSRYGLRYDQLAMWIAVGQEARLREFEAKLLER